MKNRDRDELANSRVLSPSGMEMPGDAGFLGRLNETDRSALLALTARRKIPRGTHVFAAGSPGSFVYFLETGRIKIYHLSPSGREVLLWFCLSGEIFGLAEVCHGGGRQVYAEACENSTVLGVAQQDFKIFLEHHPAAALLTNDVLACRLRNLGNVIQSLVASDVNERVTQLIMRLASAHGRDAGNGDIHLDIRLTHQEMANMIGTTRQSVTSALNALRRLGVLDFDASRHLCIHREHFPGEPVLSAPPRQLRS